MATPTQSQDGGLQPIKKFTLCLHGIKLESEMSVITLDQSLVDRSKKKLEDIEWASTV